MLGKQNRKKGFTLVELIVTLVIAGIVVAISAVFLISSTNIFAKSAERNQSELMLGEVLKYAMDCIQYASELAEPDALPVDFASTNEGFLYIETGELWYRPAGTAEPPRNAFGSDFYQGRTLEMEIETIPNPITEETSVRISMTLYDKHGENPRTQKMTRPLLNVATAPPFPITKASAISFAAP